MSKEIQRRAAKRRDDALQRRENALERAKRSRERGDESLARLHEANADLQADSAAIAERLRREDVAVEGDQLGEDERRTG